MKILIGVLAVIAFAFAAFIMIKRRRRTSIDYSLPTWRDLIDGPFGKRRRR